MVANASFTITPEKIEQWKGEAKDCRAEIDRLQGKYDALTKNIENGLWFLAQNKPSRHLSPVSASELFADDPNVGRSHSMASIKELPPPQAILRMLRDAGGQLTQTAIREQLRANDYPMMKFGATGNYFYSCVARLRKTGKIAKDGERLALK